MKISVEDLQDYNEMERAFAMKDHEPDEVEALTNHDGMLCKPPWKNDVHKRQYYARFIERLLWRYFSPEDWKNISEIVDDLRVDPKLKRTTRFLLKRHSPNTNTSFTPGE